MSEFARRVLAQYLNVDPTIDEIVIVCPFHVDTNPSMSVDLRRGVFYCHGGCDEPKGGGALDFIVKWVRIREGKTITRQEARRRVARSFLIPNAQTLLRENMRRELKLFASFMMRRFAEMARWLDNLADIYSINQRVGEDWETLQAIYFERSYAEFSFEVCMHSLRRPDPLLFNVFAEAKDRGLWDAEVRLLAERDARMRQRQRRLQRIADEQKWKEEEKSECPRDVLALKRQPVRLKTPVRIPPQ